MLIAVTFIAILMGVLAISTTDDGRLLAVTLVVWTVEAGVIVAVNGRAWRNNLRAFLLSATFVAIVMAIIVVVN
jgi:hypothetical protein